MKILLFTDTHGELKLFEKVEKRSKKSDFILCAGDITFFEENLKFFLKRLNKIGKKVFIVHGNHEGHKKIAKEVKKFKNIFFVHKKIKEFKDYLIIGYGGGGFAFEDEKFDKFAKKSKKKIKKKKKKKIFLIHGPPYNTRLDKLGKEHVGNVSFRRFIEENELDLVVCGHLHENEGKKDKINNAKIINPGPKGKIIRI
jgi:Icc-related predicted phosphoesterase